MAKFTILQAVNGNFFAEELPISDFKRIADVECDSLEDVYALSQNIVEEGWLAFRSVTPYDNIQKARSTSVGDLIHENETDSYFMCAPIGFGKVKIDNGIVRIV